MVENEFGLQKKSEALQKNEAFCGFPRNVQMHYIQLESDLSFVRFDSKWISFHSQPAILLDQENSKYHC